MFAYLILNYGYIAVMIGAIAEGEMSLIAAGFASYLGYLDLTMVIILSFLGSVIGDNIYFYIGRKKGKAFLEKRENLKKEAEWVHGILEKHSNWILLLFRFAYGFRAIIPLTLGTSNISQKKFITLNMIGAGVWSLIFCLGGYFFGTALEAIFVDIRKYEIRIAIIMLAITVITWILVYFRKKSFLRGIKLDNNMII